MNMLFNLHRVSYCYLAGIITLVERAMTMLFFTINGIC